jgi:hypothetical protein
LSACTRSATPPANESGLRVGSPALSFDYKTSEELLLAKQNPISGDHWSARLARSHFDGAEETDWEIQLGPEGKPLIDRRVDGNFVLHLLDTLRTLQVTEVPLSGPPESFGLGTPGFTLHWKARPAGSENLADFELRLGAPAPDNQGVYGQIIQHAGVRENEPKVQVFRGAAIQMLSRIETFDSLRHAAWSTMAADDVDEIELKGPSLALYAQRDGDHWSDRKHHPLSAPVAEFLEQLTHLRILEFVDDPALTQRISPLVEKSPLFQISLTDRHGKSTFFKVAKIRIDKLSGVFGAVSSRPGAVFLLHDQTLEKFASFGRAARK